MTLVLRAPVVQLLTEGRIGWLSGTVHERKKITDHGSRITDIKISFSRKRKMSK